MKNATKTPATIKSTEEVVMKNAEEVAKIMIFLSIFQMKIAPVEEIPTVAQTPE